MKKLIKILNKEIKKSNGKISKKTLNTLNKIDKLFKEILKK